jgi:GH24 family phage-related lysozyme (muramidase)
MGTGGSWNYKLPKGWWWVGSGSTTSPIYPHEEQFQGTPATTTAAKAYLTKFFADLKKKGIVEQFKLKSSL